MVLRFTCKEPHTKICPFHACRNADRYLPLATQRSKNTQELRIADFSCSLRCDAPLADALANRKHKKKEEQQVARMNVNPNEFICQINGCVNIGNKTFDTRYKTGKGTYIEHICKLHYERLRRNINKLSAVWTAQELAEEPARQCSYSQP